MVRIFRGSPTMPLPMAGAAAMMPFPGALTGGADWFGCVATGTGCSSRDNRRSICPLAPTRSVTLPGSLFAAGTTLLGVASALITGGVVGTEDGPKTAR